MLAEERSYALRTADLVVVGKLVSASDSPFLWGWRYSGKIVPDEVLWGPAKVGEAIKYVYAWRCEEHCNYRFFLTEVFQRSEPKRISIKGVWVLWKGQNGSWTGRPNDDAGFRGPDYRNFAIDVLKDRKLHPLPAVLGAHPLQ